MTLLKRVEALEAAGPPPADLLDDTPPPTSHPPPSQPDHPEPQIVGEVRTAMGAMETRMAKLEELAKKIHKTVLPDMRKEVRACLGPTAKAAASAMKNSLNSYSLNNTLTKLTKRVANIENAEGPQPSNRLLREILVERGYKRDF